MNCHKCNSPLNEGDKFCQVCGSVVENAAPQQAPVVEAAPEVVPTPQESVVEPAAPVDQPAVVPVQQPEVPVMAQPAPTPGPVPMGQPMPGPVQPAPMPMNNQAPMSPIPAEPAKKNNTIVIILGIVIAALVVAVIVLLFTGGSGEENNGGNETGNTNPGTTETKNDDDEEEDEKDEPTKVDTTTKTVIGGYTLILPEGYSAALEDGTVVVFDDNNQVQATLQTMDALLSQVSAEKVKSNMEGIGVTGVTSKNYTKNGKQMLIFTGTYQGYKVEFIYANYETGKLIGSVAMYSAYDTHKETVYDIITKATITGNGYSNTANYPVPGLTLEDAIK